MSPKKRYYAVRVGRERGVFSSWVDCQASVYRFSGAKCKGFATRDEATDWFYGGRGRQEQTAARHQQPASSSHSSSQHQNGASASAAASGGQAPLLFAPSYAATSSASASHTSQRAGPYQQQQQRRQRRQAPVRSFSHQDGGDSGDEEVHTLERADGSGGAAAAASSYSSAAVYSSASAAAASGRDRYAVLYCDGAAKSNPVGDAGAGVVLYDDGDGIEEFQDDRPFASLKRYLGVCSSVEAEYEALILGLRLAREHDFTHLMVRMDSELVVNQMSGEYDVHAENLKPLHRLACDLADRFIDFKMEHIRRHFNAEADALANEAVQEGRDARHY